jgi:excisionase family DNA binding protein
MSGTSLPRLLRVPEVSKITGLEPWRIYEMAAADEIPHMKVGRTLRFSEVALVEWIDEQHAATRRPEPEA